MVVAWGHCVQCKVLFTMDRLSFHHQTERGEIATGRKEEFFLYLLLAVYKLLVLCCQVTAGI